MSSYTGDFDDGGDELGPPAASRTFVDDGYLGHDPRPPSQGFDTLSDFADSAAMKESADDSFPPEYSGGGDFPTSSPDRDEDGVFVGSTGPILAPAGDMQPEEGFALREWRRQNTIRLEEKEKREREMLKEIIEEADEYKAEFYQRRTIARENAKVSNREKEKLFLSSQEKFHIEADKHYWKTIAELFPNEVPNIEKKGKKEKEKKPSIVVIQGPKPGKPTDLSRMRQILLKLKHNPPPHMKPKPPPLPPSEPGKDVKTIPSSSGSTPVAKQTDV